MDADQALTTIRDAGRDRMQIKAPDAVPHDYITDQEWENYYDARDATCEMAAHAAWDLDEWLSKGGAMPQAWVSAKVTNIRAQMRKEAQIVLSEEDEYDDLDAWDEARDDAGRRLAELVRELDEVDSR